MDTVAYQKSAWIGHGMGVYLKLSQIKCLNNNIIVMMKITVVSMGSQCR